MGYSFRYRIMHAITPRPALFKLWYGTRKSYNRLIVTQNTKLVIEGYPRCANSFAVVAFERAQRQPVTIAHHLHAQSQIILGVRYGTPVLVLTRDPAGAVTSLVTRHPEIGISQALKQYLRFYETALHHSSALLMADFTEVTTNYACVIQRLNEKFGTHFDHYENSPETDAEVFAILDELNLRDSNGKPNMVARPSEDKTRLLDARKAEVISHPLLAKAKSLYRRIAAHCSSAGTTIAGH